MNLEAFNVQLERELVKMFYHCIVEEFISVNVNPFSEKLRKFFGDADQQIMFNFPPEEIRSNTS